MERKRPVSSGWQRTSRSTINNTTAIWQEAKVPRSPVKSALKGYARPGTGRLPRVVTPVVVAVVGLLLLGKTFGWFVDTFFLTTVARHGTLEVSVAGEGVVLRREHPVAAPVAGKVIFLVPEGQRVARGTPIAEIVDDQQKRALRMRLRVVESQLKQLERESSFWGLVLGGKGEESRDAATQKKRLVLAREREQLIQLLGGGGRLLVAEESGLVSFSADGLEEKLDPGNATSLLSFDRPFPRLRNTLGGKLRQVKDREVIREGNYVFKIVDNFRFWILADLPGRPAAFAEGAQVKVRLHGDRTMYQARVERIFVNPSARRQRLLLSLDRQIGGLDRLRWVKLEVISLSREGIILPRSAVVERNGQAGVYLKVGGFSFFRAVGVLGEAQDRLAVWGIPEGVRVVVHPR